jgi:hypothetical protein
MPCIFIVNFEKTVVKNWKGITHSTSGSSGREANNPPPPRSEVKNVRNYTSIHQYAFMVWHSVKKHSISYHNAILIYTIRSFKQGIPLYTNKNEKFSYT